MQTVSVEGRQYQRCGWERPLPAHQLADVRLHVLGTKIDAELTTCPGYTTNLPEVVEIARARFHGEKTSLRDFCGGQPPDALLIGIEILEGAYNEARDWSTKNPVKS